MQNQHSCQTCTNQAPDRAELPDECDQDFVHDTPYLWLKHSTSQKQGQTLSRVGSHGTRTRNGGFHKKTKLLSFQGTQYTQTRLRSVYSRQWTNHKTN